MPKYFSLPEKRPEESGPEWCDRAAASIPPEVIIEGLMECLAVRAKKAKRPLWSVIGEIFGNGSGVSCAIVRKWLPDHKG